MPLTPAVGRPGGQRYDVARASVLFWSRWPAEEGSHSVARLLRSSYRTPTTPGLTELVVALDERKGEDVPLDCSEYAPLLEPALLIRNDATFRVRGGGPGRGSG